MARMENRLLSVESSVTELRLQQQRLERGNEEIRSSLNVLEERASGIERRLEGLSCKMTSMEITLETETNRNIRIVAENHVDLSYVS